MKLGFRHEQIESEGNDPAKTGESFGTPHDLASLSQQGGDDAGGGAVGENQGGSPEGGFDGAGRPKEGGNYGTDENPFGRDPLGNKSISMRPDRYNATSVMNRENTDAMLSQMKRKVKKNQGFTTSHRLASFSFGSPCAHDGLISPSLHTLVPRTANKTGLYCFRNEQLFQFIGGQTFVSDKKAAALTDTFPHIKI